MRKTTTATVAEMVKDLGISRGALRHHLRILTTEHVVGCQVFLGTLQYSLTSFETRMIHEMLAMADHRNLLILAILGDHEIPQNELVFRVRTKAGVPYHTARWWVIRAADMQVIRRTACASGASIRAQVPFETLPEKDLNDLGQKQFHVLKELGRILLL